MKEKPAKNHVGKPRHSPKNKSCHFPSGLSEKYQAENVFFSDMPEDAARLLEKFPDLVQKVWPLKKRHRESLALDIARLSEILTSGRHELGRNYWSNPAHVSAYLYYFLPWNLVRLARLLKNMPLAEPAADDNSPAIWLDIASGPLTLPMALWLAKPEWRSRPIHIFALDKAARPLKLGKRLFEELAAQTGEKAWKVRAIPASLHAFPGELREACLNRPLWLISAGNVLNELAETPLTRKHSLLPLDELDLQDFGCEEEERFFHLLSSWRPMWKNVKTKVQLLFIEPGTRLGGSSVMLLRKAAMHGRLFPEGPCPHVKKCPLLEASDNSAASYQKRWCHFTFSTHGAPAWLQQLSLACGLHKNSLSLSWLLLGAEAPKKAAAKTKAVVLSQIFPVSGKKYSYACSEKGVLLVENNGHLMPGATLEISMPERIARDEKSGAILI